jgi:ribosomal protein L6P/L9E
MSRIGKKSVGLPDGVTALVSGQSIEVKGPKGTRSFKATDDVTLSVDDGSVSSLALPLASRKSLKFRALVTALRFRATS